MTTHHEESTYALLVRSEEEERSLAETAVYLLLILAMAFSVWQTVVQPIRLPSIRLSDGTSVAQVAESPRHRA